MRFNEETSVMRHLFLWVRVVWAHPTRLKTSPRFQPLAQTPHRLGILGCLFLVLLFSNTIKSLVAILL